jgi:hypothetical protein
MPSNIMPPQTPQGYKFVMIMGYPKMGRASIFAGDYLFKKINGSNTIIIRV